MFLPALLSVWLIAVLIAFYTFFWRFIQVFDDQGLYANGPGSASQISAFLDNLSEQYRLTEYGAEMPIIVFHWLDPNCRCLQLGMNGLFELINRDYPSNVSQVILVPAAQQPDPVIFSSLSSKVTIINLTQAEYRQSKLFIPSVPSALIYKVSSSNMSYLGPHYSGLLCGQGSSYIDLVLNNLSHGFDPNLFNLEQTGCFCRW